MSRLRPDHVKLGFWVNVDKGPIMGQTITTDTRTGNLVVALLAVLTTFGLGHLWNIVIFFYHQIRTQSRPSDGHFHQQQALLRTLPTPNAIMSDWIKLWWTWRGKNYNAFARTWILALISLIFTASTVAVGIFVSYVISTADVEVLVNSPLCGPLDLSQQLSYESTPEVDRYVIDLGTVSRSYSKECYQVVGSEPAQCSMYISPSIPFTKTREDCPWANMCSNITQPGIIMDSGLIDVNRGFGLNLSPRDGVRFRRKNTCAFLEPQGRYVIQNFTFGPSKQFRFEESINLYFGENKISGVNYTFRGSYLSANVTYGYDMLSATAFVNIPSVSDWVPLPEMQSSEADLTIGALGKNHVMYHKAVQDPFFAAHVPFDSHQDDFNNTLYLSDFPLAIFACKEQYQFCFQQTNGSESCTALQGAKLNASAVEYPGASNVQLATLQMLQSSTFLMKTFIAINVGIKASDRIIAAGIVRSLPDDQWLQELIAWESNVWAGLQMAVADYAIGFAVRTGEIAPLVRNDTGPGGKQLCQSQRMRTSGGFVNINVFALAFVIACTCAFTLLDILLLRILIFTRIFRRVLAPRIDRWIQDGVFQLQRKAYEAQESVTWERHDKEIPITKGSALLPKLEVHVTQPVPENVLCTCVSPQSPGIDSVGSDKTPSLLDPAPADPASAEPNQSPPQPGDGVEITQSPLATEDGTRA